MMKNMFLVLMMSVATLVHATSSASLRFSGDVGEVVVNIANKHGYRHFFEGKPKPAFVHLDSAPGASLTQLLEIVAGQVSSCAYIVLRPDEIGVRYKPEGECTRKQEAWSPMVQVGPDLLVNPKYMTEKQAAWLTKVKTEAEVAKANVAPVEPPAPKEKVIEKSRLDAKNPPIPSQEKLRLAASKEWERTGVAPELVGSGGQIEYAYNQSRPTVTCAPLHICTINFIAGESITSMSIGDSVRWLAQSTTAGQKPVVVVKPTQAGLATNLVVTTDKGRVYYMHLVSSKTDYVPLISFYDPDAMVTDLRVQAEIEQTRRKAEEAAKDRAVVSDLGKGTDPVDLDFGYSCEGKAPFKPSRIFSNATHTYIQMPPEMKSVDAPAVFNTSSGSLELLNSRLKNGYFVIDGKPQKIKLLVGTESAGKFIDCARQAKSNAFDIGWGWQ